MVGLEVTPTTCCSRRSLSSPPEVSRWRERSSSQIATPAEASWASRSVIAMHPSVSGGRTRDGADPRQGGVGRGHDPVDGEAELLEQHLVGRAGPVVLQAHALAVVANQIV